MRIKKLMTYLAYTATILSVSEFSSATNNDFMDSLKRGAQSCKDYKKYMNLKQDRFAHQYDEVQMQVIQRKMDALDSKSCEMKFTLDAIDAYNSLKKSK